MDMKAIYKSLFRFAFLMWAINPAVEHIDWLFYTICALEGVSLVGSIVLEEVFYRRHPEAGKKRDFLKPDKPWEYFDLMITFVGVIIAFSMGSKIIWAWLGLFLMTVFIVFFPDKKYKPYELPKSNDK